MKEQINVGTHMAFAIPSQILKAAVLLLALLGSLQIARAQELELVPYNQTWKYEQSNIDLGTAWKDPGFDDSGPGWGMGAGPLGFPANEGMFTSGLLIQTLLNRATNAVQPRTYYFRTTFVFNGDPGGVILVASNLIDDAAVFYLNGAEVARVAFPPPPTPILFTSEGSRAASDVNTYGYDNWTNTAPPLVQGVNTYAVEVHQTGGNSSDLVFATKLLALIPTPITITAQPTNRTVPENRTLNLTIGIVGSTPFFQWYKGSLSSPIPDATNQTYTIASTTVADTGDYFVVVTNYLNSVTSLVARLTVVTDTNGPVLIGIRTDETFERITLQWDETISQGPATEFGSYIINDPSGSQVFVTGVDYLGTNVVLHIAPALLITDTNYSIEIDFQSDLVGNPTKPVGTPIGGDPNGIVTNFATFSITRGFTRFQAYLGLPPNESIAQFVAMPIYPNSPTFSFYTNVLNWPQSVPSIEQYAMRFTGLFIAPENGIHRFDPAHDDEARLRIYSTPHPGGAFSEMNPACCTALTGGPTLDVDMVAGQAYFYELIVREFGGGDYAGIGVTLPSGANSAPISAEFLAIAASPVGASVTITQQPANKSFLGNPGVGLLSQDFNAGDGGFTVTTPQPYDGPWVYNSGSGSWQQNGQGPENNHPNTSLLDSPPLNVTVSGEVVLSFEHRYSFEQDTTSWDGGQVRVSVNGGPFIAVTSFTSNSYNGSVGSGSTSQLAGQPAFVGNSPGFVFMTSVASLGTFNAGDVIRVEFMAANDGNTVGAQSPNWEITSVQLIQGATVSVTFSVRASGLTVESTNPPQAYQWFRNGGAGFVLIPGANSADYWFSPQPSDNGAQFRATVSVPGASATSAPATLTFGVAGPRLSVQRSGGNLIITWPGSFTTFTLETAPAIPSATWTSVSSTVVNGENTAVIPIPATGNAFYRLRQ